MNQSSKSPLSDQAMYKAFLVGALVGLVAIYLVDTYAYDTMTQTGLSGIFFPTLMPTVWFFGDASLTGLGCIAVYYVPIALLYGYLFLCFRTHPYLAGWIFFSGTVISFFLIMGWLPFKIVEAICWPLIPMKDVLVSAHFSTMYVRIAIACMTVGFWYAAVICGVRFIFARRAKSRVAGDGNHIIVPCPECRQQLRLAAANANATIRCPNCHHVFHN